MNNSKSLTVLLCFLVLLLLGFSTVPSATAVPSTRLSFKPATEYKYTSNQDLYHPSQMKGRMDIETSDYSGTGANNHHDPSPPGPEDKP